MEAASDQSGAVFHFLKKFPKNAIRKPGHYCPGCWYLESEILSYLNRTASIASTAAAVSLEHDIRSRTALMP